jgi:hypothetical protein
MRNPLQSSSSSFPDLITARSLASCFLPQGIVRSGGGAADAIDDLIGRWS